MSKVKPPKEWLDKNPVSARRSKSAQRRASRANTRIAYEKLEKRTYVAKVRTPLCAEKSPRVSKEQLKVADDAIVKICSLRVRNRKEWNREVSRKHINEYLQSHPCVDCGESNIDVLEFDHRGDKFRSICQLAGGGWPLSRVLEEILKCDIRCCNCHMIKTRKERNTQRILTNRIPPKTLNLELTSSETQLP